MTKVFYSADNNPMLRDGITGDWLVSPHKNSLL